jgi:Na+/H+-dicarboxylate symporter
MSGKGSRFILWGIIVGILAGFAVGTWAPETGESVAWFGELFLQMLKLIVVPLVLTSMISGIAGLGDIRHLGHTGTRTVLFYVLTTFLSVLVGLILVNIIQPGSGFERSKVQDKPEVVDRTLKQLRVKDHPDLVERIENAPADQRMEVKREVIKELIDKRKKSSGEAIIGILRKMFPPNIFQALAETNVLAIIIFALIFGGILTTLGDRGRLVIDVVIGCNEAIMRIVHLLMYLAPPGIFALVAGKLGAEGGGEAVWGVVKMLAWYTSTVIVGLAIHCLATLPLILWLITRRNPLKVSERSANFVLPLGATVNMDGTALYEAVAVMFIAQAYEIDMGVAQQVIIFLTATLASVGAAGIPEAGLVTMVMVLAAVGLPLEGMALILVIDWFLDRCRTTVNVWGDSVGAAVIDRFEEGSDRTEERKVR